jgi:hypothetical protein
MNKALEDLQAGRDPFAPSREDDNAELFQNFAKWSRWLTILAGVLAYVVTRTLPETAAGDPSTRYIRLGTGLVCCLMVLASLVLGIIALSAMRKHGTDGILKPALLGVTISIVFLSFFGSGFVRGYQNAQARAALDEQVKKIRARDRMDLTNDQPLSAEARMKQLNETQSVLDQAANSSSGDQALITRAMSGYLTRAKAEVTRYSATLEPIPQISRFDMSAVTQQNQVEAQMQQVKAFIAANDKLLAFLKNTDQILIGELEAVQLSQLGIDAAMRGFRRSLSGQNELTLKVRMQDKNIGMALLGALELIDSNWGKWKYSTDGRMVIFDDPAVRQKFIACLKQVDTAKKEQLNAQRELAALIGKQG